MIALQKQITFLTSELDNKELLISDAKNRNENLTIRIGTL